MADIWKSIFNGTIDGRHVIIKSYDEGGYRIHTNQGADVTGTIQREGSSTIIIPPTEQGRRITIEGETPDEIRAGLLAEGFSKAAAIEIVGKLRA